MWPTAPQQNRAETRLTAASSTPPDRCKILFTDRYFLIIHTLFWCAGFFNELRGEADSPEGLQECEGGKAPLQAQPSASLALVFLMQSHSTHPFLVRPPGFGSAPEPHQFYHLREPALAVLGFVAGPMFQFHPYNLGEEV